MVGFWCGNQLKERIVMDLITSLTSQVLGKAMDGTAMRHKAISSNLANVDTPGYKHKGVSFEDSLKQAITDNNQHSGAKHPMRQASNDEQLEMSATQQGHFGGNGITSITDVNPQITESADNSFRNDGSGVDVETEMVQLAKNTQRYLAFTNLQGRFNKTLKSSIMSGS